MKTLDMRGHPCPIPVVNAKKALAEEGAKGVELLVDNIVAVQNLEKLANGTGCAFSYKEDGALYRVSIIKDANSPQVFDEQPSVIAKNDTAKNEAYGPVVFISCDSMGRGAEELGRLLIKGFIFSLTQLNPPPEAVIFINSGVRLATEEANTTADLKELEKKGVSICVCGTCANYYKLTQDIAVGSIVDMMFITNRLAKASSIITI